MKIDEAYFGRFLITYIEHVNTYFKKKNQAKQQYINLFTYIIKTKYMPK